MRFAAILVVIIAYCVLGSAAGAEEREKLSAQAVEFFEKRIRPVLIRKCYGCHSAEANDLEGGLMLDNRAAVVRGGDSGAVVVPGKPDASLLIKAVRYQDDSLQMPPDGKLPGEAVADFEQWVKIGAPDPRTGPAPNHSSIEARARKHWAFQVPMKPSRPTVSDHSWPRTEIDYFVLARLEQSGIQPSRDADARTLVRRLFYDLTGLPPTYEQVQAFAAEPSEEAYEEMVDHLLASKQFGERWARHWLDVARFGDTKGYVFTQDRKYPHAYKYRDWVINSLNEDLPFDEFFKLQIAADRFQGSENRDQLAALGYLTLGRRFLNNTHDIIDDRIDVVFRGMMGLTVGCARCHDHKYDPVSIQDYYSLYGVFQSSREQQDKDLPLRLVDSNRPRDARVFIRGSAGNQGEVVRRQFPKFFSRHSPRPFTDGSGRRELAEAIVSHKNPLTARVFVNRVWFHLFGAGLVRTPSDFGLRSDPPEQQDGLDYLAVTLQEEKSIKGLIRQIVLSSVYRQVSEIREEPAQLDPENRLLWRANRRRLDFEAMRDSLLAVSGQLDRTVGGASARIDGPSPSKRRALYAFIDRQNLPGLFRTFDFASPDIHSPKRPNTTVPQQALYLMNNHFVLKVAEATVEQLDSSGDLDSKVRRLYKLILQREPDKSEVSLSTRFLQASSLGNGNDAANPSALNAWQRFAQTLLFTNEFMFLD